MNFREVRLSGRGTDLRAREVQLRFNAVSVPYFQRPKGSWVRRVVVTGMTGEAVLTPPAPEANEIPTSPGWAAGLRERFSGWTAALAGNLVPVEWGVLNGPEDTVALVAPAAGGSVRASALWLGTGEPGQNPGFFSVGQFDARGPGGVAYRATGLRGSASWRGTWLTLRGAELAPGVTLDALTVEAVQLVRRGRLEGEATVRALGGELRAQGTAGPGERGGPPTLAVACAVTGVGVLPLADLLGVPTPVPLGGTVRAGQFSFRGDPTRPAEGTGSVLAEIVDFRFGSRAWQRLRLAASFLPPRATVHELKLVQGANVLDLAGEFPIAALSDPWAAGWRGSWRAGSVSGRLDARLGDLKSFGDLLGPTFPPLTGRLSLRGELRSPASGTGEPEGSLLIEGGPVSVRGTPLDRLQADVRLHHGELNVNDLKASRGSDTLTGKGTFRVAEGPFRYAAEGRAHLTDVSLYAGALPPGMFPNAPRGALDGEWSGDGTGESHAGAFKGRANGVLVPKGGPGALPRPVDLEAEGTYSPESVAFRRFLLRDGAEPKAEFHLRLENVALPWTQNAAAVAAGHFLQPDGVLAGRVEARDFALDLLVPLLPARLGVAPGTDGRVKGWLDLAGTPRVPRLTGAGQLRRARLRWLDPARDWAELDALGVDWFAEGGDHLRLERGTGERPPAAGGGGLAFGGRVEWAERDAPLGLDLWLQLKNGGLLDNPVLRARGDADLTVNGLHNAPEVSGTVRLREGARFWPQLAFAPEPPPVSPVATALGATGAGDGASPWADATWDLRVTSASPVLMEGAEGFRGELRPDFRVAGTGRQPSLEGGFTLRRAKVALPAAEMELEDSANVRFDPDASAAPGGLVLDLSARKTLPPEQGRGKTGTRLRADFSGPAREGRVTFSAEPPDWSSAEVAAFLIEGKVPLPASDPDSAAGPGPAPELPPVPKLFLRLR